MKLVYALVLIFSVGALAFATTGFAGDDCQSCKKSTVATAAEGDTYVCPKTGEVKTRATAEAHGEKTCPIATALEDTELSEHGQAVLTLGKAGKPVWIKEAGFGLIDSELVQCPVHFATYMTHHVASQGAEAGCAKCQAVIDTAPEKKSCDKDCDKTAA
ncbi:MAG: hypothetical protein KTR15_09645 [Phycisphaeraceae bacterium]|nr:hypothetical protein [Phycisphaeraceae bacterium]